MADPELIIVDPSLKVGQTDHLQPQLQTFSQPLKLTKRAFQNRFPKLANGISTKYDALSMFMTDSEYAAHLNVTGTALIELRMLIQTGLNRMGASPLVDYGVTDAAEFTYLLMQPFVPEAFRLTVEERASILSLPLKAHEIYKG